jgi:hypothetical protein
MTSSSDDVEQVLRENLRLSNQLEQVIRENLRLRKQLAEEITKAEGRAHKLDQWWRFGRSEDQPLILALVLVLIAITLYFSL